MVDYSGRRFRQYHLTKVIGTGGFADVYEAVDVNLQRRVAIKVLHTRLTQEDMQAFLEEARIVARMEHPGIVKVIEFDQHEHVHYLVMNYAPNGSVRQRHSPEEIVPLATVVSYVWQVAEALEYIHAQGVIHQDIKPENMLLGKDEEILLSDFGIATFVYSASTVMSQNCIGTVVYMAPERFQGIVSAASDQYSLAICVYEWLTGAPPFRYGSALEIAQQHTCDAPRALRESNRTIPHAVEHVVLKALEKDAQHRFTSVKEFAMALEKATQAPSELQQARRRKRQLWQETLVIFLVTLLTSPLLGVGLVLVGVASEKAILVAEICLLLVPMLAALTRKNYLAVKLSFSALVFATALGLALQSWVVFGWIAAMLLIIYSYLGFIRAYHET